MLTGEKFRGAIVSVVSGSIVTGLYLSSTVWMGVSPVVGAFLFLYLMGAPLSYSLDILFAKRDFILHGSAGPPVALQYNDLRRRISWLLRSFAHRHFIRFIVTIIIETLTSLVMLDAAIRAMNRYGILTEHALIRDSAAALLIAVTNFLLFGNILRFDWAYKEIENPTMNIIVLAWLGLCLLMYATFKSVHFQMPPPPPSAVESTKKHSPASDDDDASAPPQPHTQGL
jgi:hypothetical protein